MKYCDSCGEKLNNEAKFCGCCGRECDEYILAESPQNKKKTRKPKVIAVIALVLVVCVASGLIGLFVACKNDSSQREEPSSALIAVESAADAIAQLESVGEELGYSNALSELTEKSSTTIDGDSYYRLQQNYQGIPVYGRTLVYVTDETGNNMAIAGNVLDVCEGIDLVPTVTASEVEAAVRSYMMDTLNHTNADDVLIATLSEDNLCFYALDDEDVVHLAYCICIENYEFVIDAHSGEIYTVKKMLADGIGYLASDKEYKNGFHIESNDSGEYILQNSDLGIYVLNMHNMSSEDSGTLKKCTFIISPDTIFGNGAGEEEYHDAVCLYNNITMIYELFKDKCNFECEAIYAYYNDNYDSGENARGGRLKVLDGKYYGQIIMGSVTGVSDVDVIAHEFGHLMSYKLVDWSGSDVQTGAINEALSDIFGEIAEALLVNNEPDWVMLGDNIDVHRDISTPSDSRNASQIGEKHWYILGEDNSEYYQSTIISHAAYLMWNGIDGNESKKIDTENLAKLWYRAMLMMPSNCDFAECRTLVELAATSMGLSDAQITCVSEAFDTVGINDSEIVDYELSSAATLTVYGADSNLYSNYTMQIAGTKTVWNEEVEPTEDFYNMYIFIRQNTSTERYYETRQITTDEPQSLDLDYGTYSITLIDDEGIGTSVSFKVKIGARDGKDNLEIYTDFSKGGSNDTSLVADSFAAVVEQCIEKCEYYSLSDEQQQECRGVMYDLNDDGQDEMILQFLDNSNIAYAIWSNIDGYVTCVSSAVTDSGILAANGGIGIGDYNDDRYIAYMWETMNDEFVFDEPEYIYAITDGVYKLTEAIHSYDMDNSTVLLYSGYFGFKGESVLLLPDLLAYLKNESTQPSSGAEQNEFTLQYPISEEDCYIIYRNYFGYEMAEGSRAAPVSRSGTGKDERLIFGLYSLNPNTGGYNTAGYFVVYVNTGVCERDDFLFQAEHVFQAEDYFY